jgi:hypothetical protein
MNINHKGNWSNKIKNTETSSHVAIDIDTDIDNSFDTHNISEHVNTSIEMTELNNDSDNSNEMIKLNNDNSNENHINEMPELITYTIKKENMINDFKKECSSVTDKSIIYEYHYEKLNKIFNIFMVLSLIWSSITLLLSTLSINDIINSTVVEPYTFNILITVLSFLGTITTGVLTIFRYKDKIAEISKYIGHLDTSKDIIDVLIKRITYSGISDQEYYKQLEHSRSILTHSNSSIYNINSEDYYSYYKRLKNIKQKKRDINDKINLDKEIKYNDHSKRYLDLLKKRLELKTQIKQVYDEAKNIGITDFDDSNIFTIDTISTHEE